MDWLESLVAGVVQGVTEFLPVSSDGHLAVTQQIFARLRGYSRPAQEDVFFDVMLHLGTLTAILVAYRKSIAEALRGLQGAEGVASGYQRPDLVHVGLLAFVATLPLVPDALFLKKWIDRAFQSPTATGVGFLITAGVLLLTLLQKGGDKGPDRTTWLDALLVGLAQAFAPLPGVSRSGLTIAAALGLGFSRPWAVGFSLLIAVPAILGASVFEIRKLDPSTLTGDRVAQIVSATILAGLVGFLAISWLVRVVRAGRLWYFSVYLVALAIAVLATAGTAPPARDPDGSEVLAGGGRGGPGGDAPAEPGPLDEIRTRVVDGTQPSGPQPGSP
ncbi:MAG: undecaprenyl-diphosphate phosphatase [Isosphaeraceae bacterium]